MGKTLRLLHIEDSERDAELMKRHLVNAGYAVISRRIETEGQMRAALEESEWNVILCDYSMPHFSAVAALDLVRKLGLDIPFIIISGTVGETLAVEAMRCGASDYLMKDNLVRLVPTIERELQEAANRQARREAEEALKASEAQLRLQIAALQSAGNAIVITDRDGVIQWVNSAFTNLTGYSEEEAIGSKPNMLKSGQHPDAFYQDLWKTILAGELWQGQIINKRKDGSLYFEEQTITPVRDERGEIINFVAIKQDVTERKLAEEEKARLTAEIDTHRQRLNNIVASVPGVVWEFWGGPELETQRFDFVSNYVETVLGYSANEWLTVPNFWVSVVHPDDRSRVVQCIKAAFNGGSDKFSFRWIAKDGRIVWVESLTMVIRDQEGKATGMRGVTIDVTNRKTLEEQLWQSQKMEAVGQLAGGVAHDFNNLLTAINGYADLTMRRLSEEDPLMRNVEEIKKAGERAAALTRQLLAFSRKQILQPKVLNLNSVVLDLEKMLRRLIGEDIELRTTLEDTLGNVEADPGQIEQVIVNLVVNARDAMPKGGKLTVETRNIYLNEDYADTRVAVKPGPHVMLAVTDTGEGMDQETKKRIFEPFFTTKEMGKGTGLGLSTVYGIVKQSGGTIWVYSEVSHGTTFKIYLPRVDDVAADHIHSSEQSLSAMGTETILLAEDEEVVRKLAAHVLNLYGYRVLEAHNGNAALQIAQRHDEQIDLLLTDVVMPDMSGRELAQKLADVRCETKILFMSGYTDDAILHHGVLEAKTPFIQKPFTPDTLGQKVREVLDSTD